MARVVFEHVYKRFGDVTAVHDLNIDVADKEFLVFVGPSGCGKSTSLRMLAGLEEISDGQIIIGDRVVNNLPPKDRDIAMVFQSYALYPHMTVYDNIAFGLRLRKTPKQIIDERVHEVSASLGISELLDRRPRQLSGGQRQRVAVARAIVREPAVFLMDEPLSNLDAKLRVEARTFISKLHQRLETTFIYVTHDQVEAMTMGTRIAVLSAGELQQIATPNDLYNEPANKFVAGFIGSPSMNFFDANLSDNGGKLQLDLGFTTLDIPEHRADRYRSHVGQRITFGIRPEDIHHPKYPATDVEPQLVEADVDVIELMGNEKIVYLKNGDHVYLARMDPRSDVRIGLTTGALFNMANMHLFDIETGLAI